MLRVDNGLGTAAHGHTAGAHRFHHPVRPQHFQQAIDLVLGSRNLENQRLGAYIHHVGAERHR